MEKILFYDTCSLLRLNEKDIQNKKIHLSSASLEELNNIKESSIKDESIKAKARYLNKIIRKYPEIFHILPYTYQARDAIKDIMPETYDSMIVSTAYFFQKSNEDKKVIFITDDNNCALFARLVGLEIEYYQEEEEKYTGYKEIILNENDLAIFYSDFYRQNINKYNLLTNQYLLIKDEKETIIDQYLWDDNKYQDVVWRNFESSWLGDIRPKDAYQRIAFDSINRNQLTILRGRAGTGKSLIGLAYLFQELERENIDKIVMFVNPVATKDSCKFGFLPGSATEKILGSQIGKFLLTKIGDMSAIEKLIYDEKLVLIPVADCRGLDTGGMHAGIYITEAQNTTKDMMKLILQRVDDNSKIIIEGDDNAQVDMNIYSGYNNGLRRASEVFKGENYYGEITLKNCYRSKIADRADRM